MKYLVDWFVALTHKGKRIIVGFAALSVLSLIAYASIPDADGVIHGCYKRAGGQLRLIDHPAAQCDNNETAIQWSQTGPQGPTGPEGPIGPQGPAGPGGAKAMAYVNLNGSIGRCYNAVTGSTTGNCGFTVTNLGTGRKSVDFGFDLRGSFFSLTSEHVFFEDDPITVNHLTVGDLAPTTLEFQTAATGFGYIDRPVMVLVF